MTRRKSYPWFMRWSRIDVIQSGPGYMYRVIFLPTGARGEGMDRGEAVAALGAAFASEEGNGNG